MLFECMQVYERQNDIIILCQDLGDLIKDGLNDPRTSVQEFRFDNVNAHLLRDFVGNKVRGTYTYKTRTGDYPTLTDCIGWLYHHGSEVQSWFESDLFADDCHNNGIVFSREVMTNVWVHPEAEEEAEPFIKLIRGWGFTLPDGYRPSRVIQSTTYYPLRLDLTDRTAEQIIGITPCAAYSSSHQIIPYKDLHLLFHL